MTETRNGKTLLFALILSTIATKRTDVVQVLHNCITMELNVLYSLGSFHRFLLLWVYLNHSTILFSRLWLIHHVQVIFFKLYFLYFCELNHGGKQKKLLNSNGMTRHVIVVFQQAS
jgi:hypothetical protein